MNGNSKDLISRKISEATVIIPCVNSMYGMGPYPHNVFVLWIQVLIRFDRVY